MVDRATNVFVLLVIAIALLTLGVTLTIAWQHTAAWDQGWVPKEGVAQSKYTAEQITGAMHNASKASDFEAVRTLRRALNASYERSGKIYTHLTWGEAGRSLALSSLALLLLLLPLAFNYIRHNKVRLWNRST